MSILRLTVAAEAFLRAQPEPVELTFRSLELSMAWEALPENLRGLWHRELLAAAEQYRTKRTEVQPKPLPIPTLRTKQHLRLVYTTQ